MFLKQYNHKPRQSSKDFTDMADNNNDAPSTGGKGASSSHNSQPGATRGGASSVPTPANNSGGRRKSSTSSPYSGLAGLKRGTGDAEQEAKKASFMEQKPGSSNPISNMWNNFTKGPTGSG